MKLKLWSKKGRDLNNPTGLSVGRVEDYIEGENDYAKYIIDTLDGVTFEGLKVAIDCANGAASVIGPKTINQLDAKVYTIITNQMVQTSTRTVVQRISVT